MTPWNTTTTTSDLPSRPRDCDDTLWRHLRHLQAAYPETQSTRLWKFLHNQKGNLSRWGWFNFCDIRQFADSRPWITSNIIFARRNPHAVRGSNSQPGPGSNCVFVQRFPMKKITRLGAKSSGKSGEACIDMLGLQLHGPSGSLMWMSLQSFVIHWAVPSPGMGNHEKCTVVHHFSCCECCSCVCVCRTW